MDRKVDNITYGQAWDAAQRVHRLLDVLMHLGIINSFSLNVGQARKYCSYRSET